MKLITLIFLFIVINITNTFSQPAQKNPIKSDTYVAAINDCFQLNTLCFDNVLVTRIHNSKIKNKYISSYKINMYLCRLYPTHTAYLYKTIIEKNNGYAIVIGQFTNNTNDIPIRYITLFINESTGKIVVIEIEQNNTGINNQSR
jgi:hypothetical protein